MARDITGSFICGTPAILKVHIDKLRFYAIIN
jgi:hypothetical protein